MTQAGRGVAGLGQHRITSMSATSGHRGSRRHGGAERVGRVPDAGRPSRQHPIRCGILFRTRPRASPRWPSVTSSSVKLMAVLRRWLPNAATAARDDVAV